MKPCFLKSLLVSCLVFLAGSIIAQPPPAWNQTAIAKDPYNQVAKNRKVYVTATILQTAPVGGVKVWEESFQTTSNEDGIFNVVIGRGTKSPSITLADIGQIDWSSGPFFINMKVAVAPSVPAPWWLPADNYIDIGTTEILSMPYAIYAGNASVTNVNTSIQPGPRNTFLITDSLGNVNWQTPQAANTTVTTITNFNVNFNTTTGQSVDIDPNTTAVVSVRVEGVRRGDPILVTPQDDYTDWTIYSSWVAGDNIVNVRFGNFTADTVHVLGSQYKIVVVK